MIQIVKCKDKLYYREYSYLGGGDCCDGKTDYVDHKLSVVGEWKEVKEVEKLKQEKK